MVGVLHTRTRDLKYHPHVHCTATGGGLANDHRWKSSCDDFHVHVKSLGILRAKIRDALKKTSLFKQVDRRVWEKAWVVHSEPVGSAQATFK